MKSIKLKWIIAHEPAYLFYRVAADFQRLVNQYQDVVNVDWWNSLDQQVRDIFTSCAFEAARNERILSIQDGQDSVARLADQGVKVIKLTQEQKLALRQQMQPVYDKYTNLYFDHSLLNAIRKH